MQSCRFFFQPTFHENFKFLKKCLYDFHKILHSHSTSKGAHVCAKASKSYGWDVRNIAKVSPKMAKKQSFFDFLKNCPYDLDKNFFSHFLHHSIYTKEIFVRIVLRPYGPMCSIPINLYVSGIGASQKEKDLSRLLYRTCGSGFYLLPKKHASFQFDT